MDFRNKSIPVENVTSFDVNKTIQRSLTKAVARHGLGLYIFAGEDLPEDGEAKKAEPNVISDKEKKTLEEMLKKRGYTVAEIFPKGLNLTPEQYVTAVANINNMQSKAKK
jgi:hypothetical protein